MKKLPPGTRVKYVRPGRTKEKIGTIVGRGDTHFTCPVKWDTCKYVQTERTHHIQEIKEN